MKEDKIIGDLEVWVKYDGEWLCKTKKTKVHEDDLLQDLESTMIKIQRSIDQIKRKMPTDDNVYGTTDEKEFLNSWDRSDKNRFK